MQDDFDDGMELPDDELAGDSLSDVGDLGLGAMDAEPEMDDEVPSRPSGGARAMKSSAAPARKAAVAAPARRAPAKKAAAKKAAPKKKAAKAARKSKKAAPKKKTAAKAAKKGTKKAARKKAGKKR